MQPDPQLIPGVWLAYPTGRRHFFEGEDEHCMCGATGRDAGVLTTPGGGIPPCQNCAQRLARRQNAAKRTEVTTQPILVLDHVVMAEKYRDAAAKEASRFRRVHLLAEAKAHDIQARGWKSGYRESEVWYG